MRHKHCILHAVKRALYIVFHKRVSGSPPSPSHGGRNYLISFYFHENTPVKEEKYPSHGVGNRWKDFRKMMAPPVKDLFSRPAVKALLVVSNTYYGNRDD
jgi:hypothetical protein